MTKRAGKKRGRRHSETTAEQNRRSRESTTGQSNKPLLETAQDLRVWNELEKNPEWNIPQFAYDQAPKALIAMAKNKELKGNVRIQAINALTRMQAANATSQKTRANFEFNIHRHYQSRHTEAETPQADPETTPADAIAFREQMTTEEAVDVVDELASLGLLPVLISGEGETDG